MKIILAGVLLALLPFGAQQKTAPKHQQKTEQSPQPTTLPISHPAAAPEQNSAVNKPKNSCLDWLRPFWPPFVSNWPLVAVGLAGIWAAVRTLKTIREQTEATKKAAEAGEVSAKAILSQNRPWLLFPWGEGCEKIKIQPPYLVAGISTAKLRKTHCIFFIKNYGKTPAKGTAVNVELQIGTDTIKPPNESVYDTRHKATLMFPQDEAIALEADLEPQMFITPEDLEEVNRGTKYLWLCGFIAYTDTFERDVPVEYRTPFCYLWETRTNAEHPFWIMAGPRKHNRAT